MQKELILADLQEQLRNAEDDHVKVLINELIYKITDGQYNVRVW